MRIQSSALFTALKNNIRHRSFKFVIRYAPTSRKEICGDKGQMEKLQEWLHDWFVFVSFVYVTYTLVTTVLFLCRTYEFEI